MSDYQQAILTFKDSALHNPTEPLYTTVRKKYDVWQALGASDMVLAWIKYGVNFKL